MMPSACACFMVAEGTLKFFWGDDSCATALLCSWAGHYGLIWILGLLVPLASTWGFIWGFTPLLHPLPENCSRLGCIMNDFAIPTKFGPTSSLGGL